MPVKKQLVLFPVWILASCAAMVACSDQNGPSGAKPAGTPASSVAAPAETAKPPAAAKAGPVVVADRLRTPWAIDFAGDTIYISERAGAVVKIQGSSVTRQPVSLQKKVYEKGEGGFLGFVLRPDFAQTKKAYAYHTYQEEGKTLNRVVTLQEAADGWKETGVLIDRIPGSSNHNGGRLAIGPDGRLYITTGDAAEESLAQDTGSPAGKILRMTLEGKVPQGNPFAGSFVYSYGHRNSQGIAWDKQGRMYASEHGPSGSPGGHDEINLIETGKNYGWPAIIGDDKKQGMVNPLYYTGEKAIAPSGVAFDADNNLLVAGLRGEKLFTYNPAAKTMGTVLEKEGRLRDVKIHNGAVYVITNNTDGRGSPGKNDDRLLMLK
jgi:glucose/arabinose dehydrogenase